MRIFVLGNASRPGVCEAADSILPFLAKHAEIAVQDLRQEKDLSQLTADVAIVLGGDGAILRAARQMGYQQAPVLGVNLGKLGFLADLDVEELCSSFPHVVRGEYRVTRHLMLECLVESGEKRHTILGLNEVVIRSGSPFHMIDLDLEVDGETVSHLSGDGLILSTPIGSTGHNLSAGGPILGQELDAFVITPICSHTLTTRPVVDSANKTYSIAIRRAMPGTTLIVDGQISLSLTPEHRISVRRAPVTFGLVKVPGHSYYQTLRSKLHWGTPPNYRPEP